MPTENVTQDLAQKDSALICSCQQAAAHNANPNLQELDISITILYDSKPQSEWSSLLFSIGSLM
jgi:hypothetical protein